MNEDGPCILVCSPSIEAMVIANADPSTYLYRGKVDINLALEQHRYMKNVLQKLSGIPVIDIASYVPEDMPIEARANLVFVRDPILATPRGVVLGRFREPIRREESAFMKHVLEKVGKKIVYEVQSPGTLEGGDYVSNADHAFLGIGERTNREAIQQLLQKGVFGSSTTVIVYCKTQDKDMHRIHLDCFFGLVGSRRCVVWKGAVTPGADTERFVEVYRNGVLEMQDVPLKAYLEKEGFEVIELSDESHYRYGCNVFMLPCGFVLSQDVESFHRIMHTAFIPFTQMHQMYGGIHCATQYIP